MERARLPVHFLEARQTQLHVVLDEVPLPEVNRVRPVPVQQPRTNIHAVLSDVASTCEIKTIFKGDEHYRWSANKNKLVTPSVNHCSYTHFFSLTELHYFARILEQNELVQLCWIITEGKSHVLWKNCALMYVDSESTLSK